MCPACFATAALIAASLTSTGGLAAIAIVKFGVRSAANDNPDPAPSDLPQAKNAAEEIASN